MKKKCFNIMCGWLFYTILLLCWWEIDSSILANIHDIKIESNETMYTNNKVIRISDVFQNNRTYTLSTYLCKDCGEGQNCDNGFCRCPDYQELVDNKCEKCPGSGSPCPTSCCASSSLACLNGICTCTSEVCQGAQGVFITAQQIALSAALIMGFAALAMVIYRLCTKPRYLTARQRAAQRASESVSVGNTSYLRASLTSIQIRVLSRLRDRPPTYDNQQNNRNGCQRPVESPTIQIPPDSPPPYDVGDRSSDTHLPPPYSELILSPDGFINPVFENETNVTITRLNDDEQPKTVIENSAK